jgi:hypothetical protein
MKLKKLPRFGKFPADGFKRAVQIANPRSLDLLPNKLVKSLITRHLKEIKCAEQSSQMRAH